MNKKKFNNKELKKELCDLKDYYLKMLLDNILPFWLKYAVDKKNGGYYTALDRKGNIIDTDKSVWFQARASWVFSNAYNDFNKNSDYLEAARLGVEFLEKHCFDKDGKMFFRVTSDGKPVIKRKRYFFSETFCLIAYANYARATGNKKYIKKARDLLKLIDKYQNTKGILEPKFNPKTRASISFDVPMIMLSTIQELRKADSSNKEEYNKYIDGIIEKIKVFVKDDKKAVLEQLNPDGTIQKEHLEGRLLNPGHAIEGAWFVMAEAYERKSDDLKQLGLKMFDYMWEWGFDKKYGGIIYFQDVLNKPKSEYWHDMKFWWPQNEAAIATLYAYYFTDDKNYIKKHYLIKDFSEKFLDKEYGEWYGYLHRDGSLSTDLKGNMYKGPFHIPRMYMRCIELIDLILAKF